MNTDWIGIVIHGSALVGACYVAWAIADHMPGFWLRVGCVTMMLTLATFQAHRIVKLAFGAGLPDTVIQGAALLAALSAVMIALTTAGWLKNHRD